MIGGNIYPRGGTYSIRGRADSPLGRGAVIILVWNRVDDAVKCISSLEKILPDDVGVVFVDNSSDEDLAALIKTQFPWVHSIRTSRNAGYAGGNNAGASYALDCGVEWVYFLNDDTIPEAGFLENACDVSSKHGIDLVGSVIVFGDDPEEIQEAGVRVDSDSRERKVRAGSRNEVISRDSMEFYPCDAVCGAGFLLTRRGLELSQGFDEAMFMYFEETDLCARLKSQGGEVAVSNKSVIQHFCPRQSNANSRLFFYFRLRNFIWYSRRHASISGLSLILACMRRFGSSVKSAIRYRNLSLIAYAIRAIEEGLNNLPVNQEESDGLQAWCLRESN